MEEPVRRRLTTGPILVDIVAVVGDLHGVRTSQIALFLDEPHRRRIVEARVKHRAHKATTGAEQSRGGPQQRVDDREVHRHHRGDDAVESCRPQSDEALLVGRVDDVVVDRESLGVPSGDVHEHRGRIAADDVGPGHGEFTGHHSVAATDVEDRLPGGHTEEAVQRWRDQQPMKLAPGGS